MSFLFYVPDPFDPSGTPSHRYDATTLTLNNDTPVETWVDSVGSDDLYQAALASRPSYQSSGGGGGGNMPYVLGDQTTKNFMSVAYSVALTQPVTLFIVISPITVGNGEYVIGSHTNRSCEMQQNGQWVIYAGTQYQLGGFVGWSAGVWSCFTILFNGASSTFRANGVQQGGLLSPGTVGMDGITIGAARSDGWPTQPAHIGWGEIIVYDGIEDPAENETMLMTKWGIT